jgi:hypothetical protein
MKAEVVKLPIYRLTDDGGLWCAGRAFNGCNFGYSYAQGRAANACLGIQERRVANVAVGWARQPARWECRMTLLALFLSMLAVFCFVRVFWR